MPAVFTARLATSKCLTKTLIGRLPRVVKVRNMSSLEDTTSEACRASPAKCSIPGRRSLMYHSKDYKAQVFPKSLKGLRAQSCTAHSFEAYAWRLPGMFAATSRGPLVPNVLLLLYRSDSPRVNGLKKHCLLYIGHSIMCHARH